MPYSASAVNIPVITLLRSGITSTACAVNATDTVGNYFANDGRTWIECVNSSGSATTLTFDAVATVDGMALTDPTVSVANGARTKVGPFSSNFNQSDGNVWVTSSISGSPVKLEAFRI
jgi:hypothetical protein